MPLVRVSIEGPSFAFVFIVLINCYLHFVDFNEIRVMLAQARNN